MLCHVFVYGTLCRGECNHTVVEPFVTNVREATVRGWLYDLSYGYPAVIRGQGIVNGQLLELDSGRLEEALQAMDKLEGCEEGEYERIVIRANTRTGEAISCYIYVYPKERRTWLDDKAEFVPSGDWRMHRKGRGWLPYFAYGSCMNRNSFMIDVPQFCVIGRAVLPDYRVGFTRYFHQKWGGGVADIVPSPGSETEGVLYLIPPELLPNLDAREGEGISYSREIVKVKAGDQFIEAITYMVIDRKPDQAPSQAYRQTILDGCDLLSKAYVQKLKAFMDQLN